MTATAEAVLRAHPDVADVVTLASADRVLAVAPRSYCNAIELRDHLWQHLPADALPDRLVVLGALPGDGADADLTAAVGVAGFRAPAPGTEQAVAEVWSQVLGRARVAADDNFLDLGGDSMSAIVLLDQLSERFGVELTVDELLAAASLTDLAATIDERRA